MIGGGVDGGGDREGGVVDGEGGVGGREGGSVVDGEGGGGCREGGSVVGSEGMVEMIMTEIGLADKKWSKPENQKLPQGLWLA